ncbi:MAG: DNA-directed RNA polymerase subunit alpha C-terminal domain-containing protein [Planctomycetia bacterium]|nr:DNA-directed RNA polymerase subunit alpha C-terminal domain-containing protein [Planctomycetia bacterium]
MDTEKEPEYRPAKTDVRLSESELQRQKREEILNLSVAQIGLLVRTTNCLESEGIFTVRDLLQSPPERLLKIANFGGKTLLEVYNALEKLGFKRASRKRRETE